jgi:hypothetical protein
MVSQQNEGFKQLRAWQIKGKPSLTTRDSCDIALTSVDAIAPTALGYQAAQRIVSAPEPLQLLRDIAHNLPPIAESLARCDIACDDGLWMLLDAF